MKNRMYNNYDGYMYTVHNLSLGEIKYKENVYTLDIEPERNNLLRLLVLDGVLKSKEVDNTHYKEVVYNIVGVMHDEEYLQFKATLLNLKLIGINKEESIFAS